MNILPAFQSFVPIAFFPSLINSLFTERNPNTRCCFSNYCFSHNHFNHTQNTCFLNSSKKATGTSLFPAQSTVISPKGIPTHAFVSIFVVSVIIISITNKTLVSQIQGKKATKKPLNSEWFFCLETGIDLSSRAVSSQVLLAQSSLTSVFGMRTGGSSTLSSPQWLYNCVSQIIY